MLKIVTTLVMSTDGSIDVAASRAAFESDLNRLVAERTSDQDSVAVEVTALLLENPGLKTISTSALIDAVWNKRMEDRVYKGNTLAEKDAARARLAEILPEYIRANPDMFHTGRKLGVAVRYVPGEHVVDRDGNPLVDANGDFVQAYRHTDEEWAKLTAKRDAKAAPDSKSAAA